MEESLALIDRYQVWLYVFLAVVGLGYLRQGWIAYEDWRRSLFGLERERALARLRRSGALLALAASAATAVFLLTTFVTPSLSPAAPTPLPTISLVATPAAAMESDVTPIPPTGLDTSGCQNQQATITDPQPEAALRGTVVIRGTAAIDNFGFFKLEYRGLSEDGPWRAILAHEQIVRDGDLGTWDTSLVLPGDYALRLVVVDTAGNAPLPCTIPVRILPVP